MTASKLHRIHPADIALVWPHARNLIKEAVRRAPLIDFVTVESNVLAGRLVLWLAFVGLTVAAAAITELVEQNGRKVCLLVACGGQGRERWLSSLAEIEAYAKVEGCSQMRIGGRKGWERVLKDYEARYVTLEKDLQ